MISKKFLGYVGAASGLTAMMVLGSGAAAFAHECFNPNRSEKGNASAGAHSNAWVPFADLVWEFIPDQAECVIDTLEAAGVDTSTALLSTTTIGANNPQEWWASDGKGIDHFFVVYGEEIFGSFAVCGVSMEGPA